MGLVLAVATTRFGGLSDAAPTAPGVTEANITRLTTEVLEHSQFAHHPFDSELAGTLLDRYLDSLDGTRSVFLQTDVDGFAAYRATLAQAARGPGDTSAARAIFARYVERLGQRASYVTDALRMAKFDFTRRRLRRSGSRARRRSPRPGGLR